MKRFLSMMLCGVLLAGTLAGCGGETAADSSTLNIAALERVTSLDGATQESVDQQTLLLHLYQNLLTYVDDGTGHATIVEGMAQSYTESLETNGGVTYTFTLRGNAKWSDGTQVKGDDFVYAWQRLVTMETPPSLLYAADMVEGLTDAINAKDPSLLTGVSAPNDSTVVISLTEPCAYFLDIFCAGSLTLPVRRDQESVWGTDKAATNGQYALESLDSEGAVLKRSETYYDQTLICPDTLSFPFTEGESEEDYAAFNKGEIQFIDALPQKGITELSEKGTLLSYPQPSTYTLLLNTAAEPFDDPFVRQAVSLVIDTSTLSDGITTTAATGLVPYGITNRDDQFTPPESEETVYYDYRTVGDLEYQPEDTMEERIAAAKNNLSQAGFPDGSNLPELTYVYRETPENTQTAESIQKTLKETLNITVTLKPCTLEELKEHLLTGDYTIGAFQFTATYDDATAFLNRWQSTVSPAAGNLVSYVERAYDLLLYAADITGSASGREACLHDAEVLLLQSSAVIPLYYQNTTAALQNGLTGLYRGAMGNYFFGSVRVSS